MIDRAVFGDVDFLRDSLETEVPAPLVPCAICGRRDASDPACLIVDFEGERRGVCQRCFDSRDVMVPLDYEDPDG